MPPEPVPFSRLRSGAERAGRAGSEYGGWAVFAVWAGMFFDGKLVSLPGPREDRIPLRDVAVMAGRVSLSVRIWMATPLSAFKKKPTDFSEPCPGLSGVPEIYPASDGKIVLTGIRNSVRVRESDVSMTLVRVRADGHDV